MSEFTIKFPAELTIVHVEQIKQQAIELVNNHEVVCFDDSEVSRIDTTGLQLIIAIVSYVLTQNKQLVWQCSSPCIVESIKLLGVNENILAQYLSH